VPNEIKGLDDETLNHLGSSHLGGIPFTQGKKKLRFFQKLKDI
jgi:hypothetical protein